MNTNSSLDIHRKGPSFLDLEVDNPVPNWCQVCRDL